MLINNLETGESVDFNGVISALCRSLNFALSVDGAENNPGSDQALHHRPADLCGHRLVAEAGA